MAQTGHAYPCFCSADRLHALRLDLKSRNGPSVYDRHCLHALEPGEARSRMAQEPHVIRFKVWLALDFALRYLDGDAPQSDAATQQEPFTDLIYGSVSNLNAATEDFILLKSDGYPTYHLANVVDDHLMQISHVLRGEVRLKLRSPWSTKNKDGQEWIPSTPKHLGLYRAFGWEAPQFAHLPILVGAKGNKLSKRDGDVRVEQFKVGEIHY
jgi:glutamyl-tRNA synthetase